METATYNNLEELYTAMKNGEIENWDNLPTFGGEEPADTHETWSWDNTHVITGSCVDELSIEER